MFSAITYIIALVFWLVALITDIARGNVMWALVDFFLAVPVGVIRGALIIFGVA